MSAFGRDLVGNVNCGTVNPIMQMTAQMQGMGAQIADVRALGSVEKGASSSSSMLPRMGPADLMRAPSMPQQQVPIDAAHFMQGFQPSPSLQRTNSLPQHLQHQQQHQRQLAHMQQQQRMAQQGGAELADQFHQMELQSKEFERAYQMPAPSSSQAPEMWSHEFQQQHPAMRQQQPPMMHNMGPTSHSHFDMMRSARMMNPMMGPMGGMNRMNYGMPMGMSAYPSTMPAQSASAIPADAKIKEMPANVSEEEFDVYTAADAARGADINSLEDAYKAATAQDLADNFPQAQEAGPAFAGGMDKDMLSKLMNSDNPKWRNSKFLKFIDKISKGEIEFKDNQAFEKPAGSASTEQQASMGDEWASEFGSAAQMDPSEWQDEYSVQQNHPASWSADSLNEQQSQAEAWQAQYANSDDADTEFKDFDWEKAIQQAKADQPLRADPKYAFADQNPFEQSADSFSEGVKLFNSGKINDAILAFENTVKKQPEHADAWAYLGEAQAQNEEENNAIAAFLQCVSIDPYNLKALLQLGVSYTNDLDEHRALGYLKTWMLNNPDYQHSAALSQQKQELSQYEQLYGGEATMPPGSIDDVLHGEVTKMFLSAAALRPDDADVHTVLGVLYHITSDYDKAIEAFKNAVKLKPDDAQLWNKLGATQANSTRSADSVFAYQRALQLRPAYVRALANLAISYANQGLHEDAVRTYLTTLTHNADANHVWSYLRISLSHMQRDELVELSHQKNVELFRPFFKF